uniref:Uncharacterized protein n=1 Tax=Cucumis melo TaxID=3656 RepID=A0A9I9CTU3_CUCME
MAVATGSVVTSQCNGYCLAVAVAVAYVLNSNKELWVELVAGNEGFVLQFPMADLR